MTAIAHQTAHPMPLAQPGDFSHEQIDLIKQTVAAGTTDLELALFLEVAKSSGLNPFQRQIYAVMRWDAKTRKEKMVIQTGIDGYRLIAARSGVHMGTTDPEFGPVSKERFPEFARVIVRKLVQGQVAEFPATARWSEYVQTGKEGPTAMWKRMPHTMLGKCAEALALRKAFPAELSGVYSDVEMAQADNPVPAAAPQARRADVTREVAQAAGVTPQQDQQPQGNSVNAEALKRVEDMAARVRAVAPTAEVDNVLMLYAWREDMGAAKSAYAELRDLGLKYAPQGQPAPQAQQGDVVDGQFTPDAAETPAPIMKDQIGQLQAAAKGAGADTSEKRAALWAWILQRPEPVGTTSLTSQDATDVLAYLTKLSPDQRTQALGEALAMVEVTGGTDAGQESANDLPF